MSEHHPTTRSARGFWTTAPGTGEIRTRPLAAPGENQVLVRTLFSGVSRGSESLVFHGRVPESEYQRMRAPFQQGEFPFPVQYGYSCVGRVECGPSNLLDETVFCLHPHQDLFIVPADAVFAVPNAVPPERAVLAANAETALNALWDAGAAPGDKITVVGGGVVGLLVARLAAAIPGTETTLVDINLSRRELAAQLGLGFASPSDAPRDQDIVFHTSGSVSGLDTALDAAGFEARVVELSWYGDKTVPVALGGTFHSRRIQIQASQVGHVPAARRARWTRARRLELALSLLEDKALDVLIDRECEFEALPELMPGLTRAGSAEETTGLCTRVIYSA